MTVKRKIVIGILFIFSVLISLAVYELYQWNSFISDIGPCGIGAKPNSGKKINLNLDTVRIDKYIDIPGGKYAIAYSNNNSHSYSDIPPILIRLDNEKQILWAVILYGDRAFYKMSSIKLVVDDMGKRIRFFNDNYGEPGTIYLKENYDFDYLCLESD